MIQAVKRYAFINAKLHARISKLFDEEFLLLISQSGSLIEAMALLKDTAYSTIEEIYQNTGDLKSAELELLKQEVLIYREIAQKTTGATKKFIDALVCRFEVNQLKILLRLWFDYHIRGRSVEDMLGYLLRERIHYDLNADSILQAADLQEIAQILKSTPYAAIIQKHAAVIETELSLFKLETALDHYYYAQLQETVKLLDRDDCKAAQRLIGIDIDMQNINWIGRFKTFYNLSAEQVLDYIIPWGYNLTPEIIRKEYNSQNFNILAQLLKNKYGSLQSLLAIEPNNLLSRFILIERILEEILKIEIQRVLSGYPFTIGIILVYFLLKSNEIRNIITLLNAKHYGLSAAQIQEHLVLI